MSKILICVVIMAVVTYIPRVLPIILMRRKIKSKFIKNFLDYTPYAVLGALTFPDIFYSTGNYYSAVAGTVVAIILGCFKQSLVVVAIAAIITVFVFEILL